MHLPLNRLRHILQDQNVDAALISSHANIIYLTGYAGFSSHEREAFILITKTNQYLFTDSRYIHEIETVASHFLIKQISAVTPLSRYLSEIINNENITSLGIEVDNITVAEYERIQKVCKTLFPLSLEILRLKKTPEEISAIQKACNIGDEAFSHITPYIKENTTEKELAFELETYIRKTGSEISFPSIVAFGKNAAIPHHKTDDTKLMKNSFVLFDFGVLYKNYCSDMTRTVFFGKASPEQKKIYQTVLTAQEKAIEFLQKTLKSYSLNDVKSSRKSSYNKLLASGTDKAAREYIESQNYPTIPHALGHGIGIEVHEPPTLSPKSQQALTDGMVFSIEPGIYIPDQEGVRIEDLVTINDSKLLQLTKSQKEFIEI